MTRWIFFFFLIVRFTHTIYIRNPYKQVKKLFLLKCPGLWYMHSMAGLDLVRPLAKDN